MPLLAVAGGLLLVAFVHYFFISPTRNPIRSLPGPPVAGILGDHLPKILNPEKSPYTHEEFVKKYGRSIRIRGLGPRDERLLTLDPVSMSHILKHTDVYQKPWQSRKLITSILGCGMLSAEGVIHKRQRRVATAAFSVQNLRELVPLVFRKGIQLKDRWLELIDAPQESSPQELGQQSAVIDVSHWISRATFDVIGLAGFDYHFDAIQDETNELFVAYREMFEVVISQGSLLHTLATIYCPILLRFIPNKLTRVVERGQEVIERVAGDLIQEKKRKLQEDKDGEGFSNRQGKDLLTRLLQSNEATDLPPDQRIDDRDLLNTINTFMFAGSDTTSLTVSWLLYLLAQNPAIQTRLRQELLSVRTPHSQDNDLTLTEEEIHTIYTNVSALPYLHNVVREVLRLVPPLHSSIRVATEDGEVPTMYPVRSKDGSEKRGTNTVFVPKGTFIHVPIEAFNLDKEFWGEDAWTFNPDRWDDLPEAVTETLPGLFSNLLTFSAGPRSCIGMRFSLIEIKVFTFILLTNMVFKETKHPIVKANVVLTRPYLKGKFSHGSQLPLTVERFHET